MAVIPNSWAVQHFPDDARNRLQDLLSVAPRGWVYQLWSFANQNGMLLPPPEEKEMARRSQQEKENERALVRKYRLSGHEESIDSILLWNQIIEMCKDETPHPKGHALSAITQIGDLRPEFLAGTIGIDVSLEPLFFEHSISQSELVSLANELAVAGRDDWSAVELVEFLTQNRDGNRFQDLPPESAIEAMAMILDRVWRQNGVLRGPCPRCARETWAVTYRDPESRGRPPLVHTYCPTCVVAIQREKARIRLQRHRDKASGATLKISLPKRINR